MFCRNCGKEISDKASVCIHCGVKAGTGNRFCPSCGTEVDPLAVLCIKCGHSFIKKQNDFLDDGVKSIENAIETCLRKFATFEGRANRGEYWSWWLFSFLIGIIIGWIPILGWAISIIIFIPSLAVSVRRLHDINKSGFWYLILFIPIIGWIWFFILMCQPSKEGDNKYGENPN